MITLVSQGKIKKGSGGSGGPTITNDLNVLAIPARDFVEGWYAQTDDTGIRLLNPILLKPGATAIELYSTSGTKDVDVQSQGEQDAESMKPTYKANFPGAEISAAEFAYKYLGEPFVIAIRKCESGGYMILGDVCTPLYLKPGFKANKDKTGFEFTFESSTGSRKPFMIYEGTIPTVSSVIPTQAPDAIAFTNTVTSVMVTAGLTAASMKVSATGVTSGKTVTLIGQDADPAKASTLTSGQTNAGTTTLLAGGSAWKSLAGATITFRVFTDATATYLYEISRS